jgi:hypothetical protein
LSKKYLSPRSLELRGNFQMHRWSYIWEDTENRVISHTPGLHPYVKLCTSNSCIYVVKYACISYCCLCQCQAVCYYYMPVPTKYHWNISFQKNVHRNMLSKMPAYTLKAPYFFSYSKYALFFHILYVDMYMMLLVCCFWIFDNKKRWRKSWVIFFIKWKNKRKKRWLLVTKIVYSFSFYLSIAMLLVFLYLIAVYASVRQCVIIICRCPQNIIEISLSRKMFIEICWYVVKYACM